MWSTSEKGQKMLTLTEERRLFVETLRKLSTTEFTDQAFEWEEKTPWENYELLADRGFLGVNINEAYGGGGMSELEAILSIEVVGRVCPHTANLLYTQQMVAPRAIDMFGTKAAKERYLPPVTAGEEMIAIAISEPEAGSDVASMSTTVEENGEKLVLNGEKTWVSNVENSNAAVVWAKFPEGLGSLVVDLNESGVEIGDHFTNMFGESQTQFFLEDVPIPQENVLTRGSEGFRDQLKALNWERLGSSALANALAANALEHALDYAGQREQFGQPIGDFQGIEWKLADMTKQLRASQALTYGAAKRAVEAERIPERTQTSIVKLFSAEMVEEVASEALQIHGANGYQQGHPAEFLYRMARARRIAAGTDEMQRNTIATSVKNDGLALLPGF
jgi:alkylation response protein AidB-like acyl-CoA dehydrogenase